MCYVNMSDKLLEKIRQWNVSSRNLPTLVISRPLKTTAPY